MQKSEFKISVSVECYDEKNWWNYYVAEKRIVSRLSKISNPNFDSTNWRLDCRLCQNFTFLSSTVFEKKTSKSVTAACIWKMNFFHFSNARGCHGLWRLISQKQKKIGTWNFDKICNQVFNLCYKNLDSISSIVWKLCAFLQRSNVGNF